MYSDSLFNFYKLTEDQGLDAGAELLLNFAAQKPFYGMDCGIRGDDIWARADRYRACMDLFAEEDEDKKNTIRNSIYFCAGIMPDSDSVENRFEAVENLERTIIDFKDSDEDFGEHLVAIGTCGIDHDWDSVEYEGRDHEWFDNSTIRDERDLFALQLTLGKKLDMPVVVHSSRGFNETADVLKAVKWNRGVIHGFAYTQSELEFFLDLGWYIGFSGTVTYGGKNKFADMADVVSYVPKDRILIETDSPYYAPVPVKGGTNTPGNIRYIYEYIAAKRGMTIHRLCETVDKNFEKLFLK